MTERKKVLIIDDEEDFIELYRERLEHAGYEVLGAYDGETGMEKMRREPVDIVLLDIMLPGMDGFEFVKRVKVADGKISQLPIVIITAYTRELDQEQLQIVGDMPVMHKPFEAKDLLKIIRERMS